MPEILYVHLMEALKLGQRIDGRAFAQANPREKEKSGPWLMPFLAPFQQASFEAQARAAGDVTLEQFEADAATAAASLGASPDLTTVAFVRCETLQKAIAEAAFDLNRPGSDGREAIDRLLMRTGLQLYGVHIIGNDEGDKNPLRLANADLPFSLRFIACSFHVPLVLSSAQMVTLDLSGSAVPGVDASFIRLSGSLRLRRLLCTAPVDFSGARIHGYLDGADMTLLPFGELPTAQAVDPHRGLFSLNQAEVDNEIRLHRAQIWGGLSMRGLVAKRSLKLDDAVILSPLAVVEAMLIYDSDPAQTDFAQRVYRLAGENYFITCAHHHAHFWWRSWRYVLSNSIKMIGDTEPSKAFAGTALHVLFTEKLRSRTSAIRADAIQVGGSIFMNRISCHGRLRMKYAQIAGGLTLTGANLRSPEASRRIFDHHADTTAGLAKLLCDYRLSTYNSLTDAVAQQKDELAAGADPYALDLRETRIEGDVRIGFDAGGGNIDAIWATRIDGVVALDQSEFDGRLFLDDVRFAWTLRVKPNDQGAAASFADRLNTAEADLGKLLLNGRQHQLSARGLTTADTVSLCGCTGLAGADFSNAILGGDLLFHGGWSNPIDAVQPAPAPPVRNLDRILLDAPALEMRGRINLAGARVDGDARLQFCPVNGPWLFAERLEVTSLLSIMPQPARADAQVDVSLARYCAIVDRAATERGSQRGWAAQGVDHWRQMVARALDTLPMIDLGNARAVLFEHPPQAWPQSGRLLLSGFHYQRAGAIGPLVPHPSGADQPAPWGVQRRLHWWRRVAYLFLALGVGLWLVQGGWLAPFVGDLALASIWAWLGYVFLAASAYLGLSLIISPRPTNVVPMAHYWLDLQPPGRNPYRTASSLKDWALRNFTARFAFDAKPPRGNMWHSLEPYSIAADALRREGRWISANLVEQQRFRVRTRQLSWRIHILQKIAFLLAEWMTEYGYNYARVIFATALCVVLTAGLADHARNACAITAKVHKVAHVPALAIATLPPTPAGTKACASPDKDFDPLMFAIDTVLPVISLSETAEWEVERKEAALPRLWWLSYERLFALAHICGLLGVGILLLGLSTRLGNWFARYGD